MPILLEFYLLNAIGATIPILNVYNYYWNDSLIDMVTYKVWDS
jgi:hypothetical protein